MSLKGFHLVFVSLCTLMFGFLILWAFVLSPESSPMIDVIGWVGAAGVVLSLTYGVYFLRKIRRLHI